MDSRTIAPEIRGVASSGGVTAAVYPGGALAVLTLTPAALDLGAPALAASVLDAVAAATARANQRTKHALREALAGLDPAALGRTQSAALTERVEATVPDTWRTP